MMTVYRDRNSCLLELKRSIKKRFIVHVKMGEF
jgi:hypothetical protein